LQIITIFNEDRCCKTGSYKNVVLNIYSTINSKGQLQTHSAQIKAKSSSDIFNQSHIWTLRGRTPGNYISVNSTGTHSVWTITVQSLATCF